MYVATVTFFLYMYTRVLYITVHGPTGNIHGFKLGFPLCSSFRTGCWKDKYHSFKRALLHYLAD
jgi:hypothetical protein